MKHQSSVGGRIDVRCGSPASHVRGAYKQWMVTKGVRGLDPDFRPASAGMHDEAQATGAATVRSESPVTHRIRTAPFSVVSATARFGQRGARYGAHMRRRNWKN